MMGSLPLNQKRRDKKVKEVLKEAKKDCSNTRKIKEIAWTMKYGLRNKHKKLKNVTDAITSAQDWRQWKII